MWRLLHGPTATCVAVLAVALLGVATVGGAQGDGEDGAESIPCPAPSSFQGTGWYQGKTWPDVNWNRDGGPTTFNTAWYKANGNRSPGVTVSADGKWEWINGRAHFRCDRYVYPFGIYVDAYAALPGTTEGSVVPYGTEEEERSEEVPSDDVPPNEGGGGDGGIEDVVWYLCWYYQYSDGTRSAYYRCDRIY